jgi:hypothetical protein
MKVVNFHQDYSKLNSIKFATLRWDRKGETKYPKDEVCLIKSPSKLFKAKCFHVTATYLKDICDEFLTADTDTDSREQAIRHLQDYYPELNEDSVLTAYFFKRIGDDS